MIHKDVRAVVEDVRIRQMRGGTVVTHAALTALRSTSLNSMATSPKDFISDVEENAKYLRKIRAASIPLTNGLRYVVSEVQQAANRGADVQELKRVLSDSAIGFDRKLE